MRIMRCGPLFVPILSLLTACLFGCPPPPAPSDPGSNLPFLDVDGNFTFDSATALPLDAADELSFSGEITGEGDVDIYELGALDTGDRLLVDVQRLSGNLDAVAAVFDSRELLHIFNDDREPDATNLNPLINEIIRGPTGDYFLGISALAGSASTGRYSVTVRITRDVGLPAPAGQIVFLNWSGGENRVVENVGEFDLTPFDAGDLGISVNSTELIKNQVQQLVKNTFRGLNLTLLNSDDNAQPSVAHSTIHFGGDSRRAFAISEQIDTFNQDPSDDSIVFTRSYSMAFSRTPSVEEMSQALANTVAHEIGHLMGLVHTADCDSLMDSSCGNDRLLDPQDFTQATLDQSIFPVGRQDALELLVWTLGVLQP